MVIAKNLLAKAILPTDSKYFFPKNSPSLPPGFVISRYYSDRKAALAEVKIAIDNEGLEVQKAAWRSPGGEGMAPTCFPLNKTLIRHPISLSK